ncbi:MAG: acyl-CoA dehydrogenase family protein [Candidatus Binataceae bacterium]
MPEPDLTGAQMIQRAGSMREVLRARQGECEASGEMPAETNRDFIKAGFYRTLQPRRFGGYEFDVPTFQRVMMEVARGCPASGWVLALTAGGHPMMLAAFPKLARYFRDLAVMRTHITLQSGRIAPNFARLHFGLPPLSPM